MGVKRWESLVDLSNRLNIVTMNHYASVCQGGARQGPDPLRHHRRQRRHRTAGRTAPAVARFAAG